MLLQPKVMLKDNHIWSHGSITNAVKQARAVCGFALKIEVECGTAEEAEEAIAAGADIVMLDNFEPADLVTAHISTNTHTHTYMYTETATNEITTSA